MYKVIGGVLFALLLSNGAAMAVCSSYPYTLTNGTTADATQVMANLNCAAVTSGPTINAATLTGVTSYPGSTEVTSGGHLLINTATDYAFLNAWGNGSGAIAYLRSPSTADTFLQFIDTGSGTVTMAAFQVNGAAVGTIVSTNYATTYNTTSDERLKDWEIPQKDYEAAIRSIWVGDFRWKKGGEADFGVRAQQAVRYFPEAIHQPANDKELWQADYGRLAPLALWGVQHLYTITDNQKQVVANTRNDVKALQAKVVALQLANDNEAQQVLKLRARLELLARDVRVRTAAR